jgi:hypothetical protein
LAGSTIPPARNPIKVFPTAYPAPHYILQLLDSAAMTMALLKTLYNQPSLGTTAHSLDKRCSRLSANTNQSAAALRPANISPNETKLFEFSDARAY